jgi:glc operon protein GlcG
VAPAADTLNQPTLTLEGAKRVVAAAIEYARSHDAPGGSIAIVDAGGSIVYVERLEGSFPASADVSIGKARTAANFRKATHAFEDTINKGRYAMIPVAAVTDFTPLQGGVPLVFNGHVVGAIGVSGASSAQQDEEIAMAGAQALAGDTK